MCADCSTLPFKLLSTGPSSGSEYSSLLDISVTSGAGVPRFESLLDRPTRYKCQLSGLRGADRARQPTVSGLPLGWHLARFCGIRCGRDGCREKKLDRGVVEAKTASGMMIQTCMPRTMVPQERGGVLNGFDWEVQWRGRKLAGGMQKGRR
jgi:hypothetical protein